jgi:hypothetical protein
MRGILNFSFIVLLKKNVVFVRPGVFSTHRRELVKQRPEATAKNRPGGLNHAQAYRFF